MDAGIFAGGSDGRIRVLGYDPGSAHRWAAWVDFRPDQMPEWSGSVEVGAGREDVDAVLEQALGDVERERCVVAVETPSGIPFGRTKEEVMARGRDVTATCGAAERFASIAWARGFRVEQLSAAEVRGGKREKGGPLVVPGLCLGRSATDREVRAGLEGNLQIHGRCNVHARDAAAIALVIGAHISKFALRYGVELVEAKAAQKERSTKKGKATKRTGSGAGAIPEGVAQLMRDQGHGDLLDGRSVRVR